MYDWYRWASAIVTSGAVSGLTGYEMTLSFTLEDIGLSHAPCTASEGFAAPFGVAANPMRDDPSSAYCCSSRKTKRFPPW